jgi:hypothetical protein
MTSTQETITTTNIYLASITSVYKISPSLFIVHGEKPKNFN